MACFQTILVLVSLVSLAWTSPIQETISSLKDLEKIGAKVTAVPTGLGDKTTDYRNADLKNDPETYAIIGAAMEVHRELGSGFLEAVYQDALELELKAIKSLTDVESAQVIHYRKATGFNRALLINFATPSLQHKRFVNTANQSA